MRTSNSTNNVLYVNRYTNVCYNEDEILDTNIKAKTDKSTTLDVIFNLFVRLLTRSEEQRLIFKHLTYDKEEYSISKLIKKLSDIYGKSERTYRRGIDYLIRTKVIYIKNGILYVDLNYNLSLLDLTKTKCILIHII